MNDAIKNAIEAAMRGNRAEGWTEGYRQGVKEGRELGRTERHNEFCWSDLFLYGAIVCLIEAGIAVLLLALWQFIHWAAAQ